MGQANAGQTVKSLRISPMPDGKGLFLNMTQRDKGGANTQLSVPMARPSLWLDSQLLVCAEQALLILLSTDLGRVCCSAQPDRLLYPAVSWLGPRPCRDHHRAAVGEAALAGGSRTCAILAARRPPLVQLPSLSCLVRRARACSLVF
jgi:hypothetical protein